MAKPKPETKIVDAIQGWVSDHNGNALKLHGNAMQRRGEPDLIGGLIVLNDDREVVIHFAVEVKQPGLDAEPIQKYRLQQWAKVGFNTAVVHSLDEFIARIDEWSNREAFMNSIEGALDLMEYSHD